VLLGSPLHHSLRLMNEVIEMRIHPGARPTLVYLPGTHGDWTLIGNFRRALGGRVGLVETTYPRTQTWSLDDYAAGVESALLQNGIKNGWLLGESFGSQVVWPLIQRRAFEVQGVILAGGFVRHPWNWAVRMAEHACGAAPLTLIIWVLFGYARVARARFGRSPEAMNEIHEFIARRTELDRQAARHRLHLIAQNDPCLLARQAGVPVFALAGLMDPVVPWWSARRDLKRNCPTLREFKLIRHADHNVLGTGARFAAEQVVKWTQAAGQPR
jgi:pimeloyl-ACP methyl ester carboxylesterase